MLINLQKSNYLIFILFLLIPFCGIPANGQKLPTALNKKGAAFSPFTVEDYKTLATNYKNNRSEEKRNQLIFMAISQIDMNFRGYQKKQRHGNSLFQTVVNVLEVGAATAISITNGERAKSIIADGLGFIQGSRDSINKNYRLLERQVLFNKMIEKRSNVLTRIYERVGKSDAEYPFERAIIDIFDYYQAGTIDSALSSLGTDSGNSASNAEKQLSNAKINFFKSAPTAAQIKTSRENRIFLDAIIQAHVDADKKMKDADKTIEAQNKIITDEKAKPADQQNQTVITQAETAVQTATGEKKTAEQEKDAQLEKLKDIFKAIENDTVLEPFLKKLPEEFPGLAASINESLDKMRDETGDINDYGLTLKKFFGLITDSMTEDPTIAERAKNILKSVE